MSERAFRLDFFIAVAALLVSALTAGALIYQTRVVAQQYAATIWPYIDVSSSYSRGAETIEVVNDGLGPALIRSAQLSVDGKSVSSWHEYLLALASEPELRRIFLRSRAAYLSGLPTALIISTSSIGPSTIIRSGESLSLLKLSLGSRAPLAMQELLRHQMTIDFCYCSLNGNCWISRATPGREGNGGAQQVSHCSTSAAIDSAKMFSQPRTKAKKRS
jgi:hypothetical protein